MNPSPEDVVIFSIVIIVATLLAMGWAIFRTFDDRKYHADVKHPKRIKKNS